MFSDLTKDKRWNGGFGWLLVCVDVYSRYVMAVALKRKTVGEIVRGYKEITGAMGTPKHLNTDLESGVKSRQFQALLKRDKTMHWAVNPEKKNNNFIIERLNRTIREILRKVRRAYKTNRWTDVIDAIVYNINHTYHRSIKATPSEVWEGRVQPKVTVTRAKSDLEVGDRVRVLKPHTKFAKRSNKKVWTKNVYVVQGHKARRYKVVKHGGSRAQWRLRRELQKVKGPIQQFKAQTGARRMHKGASQERRAARRLAKTGISPKDLIIATGTRRDKRKRKYVAEMFVDFKTIGRSHYYLVKWQGHSHKHNTWEPRKDLISKKYGMGLAAFNALVADMEFS